MGLRISHGLGCANSRYRHLHRLWQSVSASGDAMMLAPIICIYEPKDLAIGRCPTLEAEEYLAEAEEMLKQQSIWQSPETYLLFEKILTRAEEELQRLLLWFQAPTENFKAPAARLAAALLIAGDVVLPRLERLQRLLRRFTASSPSVQQGFERRSWCPSELAEQGALIAEARYVQRLFQQLPRPKTPSYSRQRRSELQEAWVTFLWGGRAEKSAWTYGEAIRTLAHSVRKVENYHRPFLVLTLGQVPAVLLQELASEGLTVMPIDVNETLPPIRQDARSQPGSWFEERGLDPVFPQLAAWKLPFKRVVVLDADTLMLENCDELFNLGPVPFASGYEMHQEQLDISRREGSRTYMLNVGVMTLAPDASFLDYLRAVATTEAFRGRLEHYAEGTSPTFQQFLDIFLLEATDRRGFAAWDGMKFLGCAAHEKGLAGSVWAPVGEVELLSGERLSHMDHCRLPLDYHFLADFPHVFQMVTWLCFFFLMWPYNIKGPFIRDDV